MIFNKNYSRLHIRFIKKLMRSNYIIVFSVLLFLTSCTHTETIDGDNITLKWNQSYPNETIEDAEIGLKWCLSFLGSHIANDTLWTGFQRKEDRFILNIRQIGFSSMAADYLASLNVQLKKTEEYHSTQAIDLGRYMALTIGTPHHYYKIVDIPETFQNFRERHDFDTTQGYVTNSGVSKVHRIINYGKNMTPQRQVYFSVEIDSITREPIEFETVELMDNGLSRFGIYDLEGHIKVAADKKVTKAGKVAKCMWCHESIVQPLYRIQLDIPGYLTYEHLQDTLTHYSLASKNHQNQIWKDKALLKRPNHTKMEITYIAFMEPSISHLTQEWNMSENEVRSRISHLSSHRHEEFPFLGDLYNRKEIDVIAPWKTFVIPESIRELSND